MPIRIAHEEHLMELSEIFKRRFIAFDDSFDSDKVVGDAGSDLLELQFGEVVVLLKVLWRSR